MGGPSSAYLTRVGVPSSAYLTRVGGLREVKIKYIFVYFSLNMPPLGSSCEATLDTPHVRLYVCMRECPAYRNSQF
jgi:hypothetical protein